MIQELLQRIFSKPSTVPSSQISNDLTEQDKIAMRTTGLTIAGIQEVIQNQTQIQYDRESIYREAFNALSHPLISGAVELYASSATSFDRMNNATVWISSDSSKYQNVLNQLLRTIDIEEHIYDYSYNLTAFGDLFAEIIAKPGLGILALKDDRPATDFYRIENSGQLIGFVKNTQNVKDSVKNEGELLPPWSIVHFKINGARKRRAVNNETGYGYRTSMIGLGNNNMQETTTYGSSIILPALSTYKRLRLAEDSILMARATRGIIRYVYAIGMDPKAGQMEMVKSVIQSYGDILKRARSINTTTGAESFTDSIKTPAMSEDIIIPIWGDVNNFKVEKIGEPSADIKFLTDIEDLRNQLATALNIPLSLLGGYQQEGTAPGFNSTLERTDIRFAKSVSKLQRALKNGITRLCQIHLSYLGMDTDPRLFDVHIGPASSAEDEEAKDILVKSSEAADKFIDVLTKFAGEDLLDREKAFNIVNDKIFKFKDVKYTDFLKTEHVKAPQAEAEEMTVTDSKLTGDLRAACLNEEAEWKKNYGYAQVLIENVKR